MKNKQEYRVGIGATSMLMIFIVLCLTTLAILALSSARTDYSMTERNVEISLSYYGAVNEAQEVIARVDAALLALRADSVDEEAYWKAVEALSLDDVQLHHPNEEHLAFSVDAGNDSTVDVVLRVMPLSQANERYQIVKHTLRYIDNWEPENDLKLFTGSDTTEEEITLELE